MSDHLPEDVLIEIFSRLPVQSVLRLRLVSKRWCSLISNTTSLWSQCLLGYFLDNDPPPHWLVKKSAIRLWGKTGHIVVLSNNGFFFFNFLLPNIADAILDCGPWFVSGMPLILQRWRPGIKVDKANSIDSVSIWVKFYGVPLEFWTQMGWSYVASAVGRPMFADRVTQEKSRIRYGRICIHVSAESPLIDHFKIKMPHTGNLVTARVEYDWKPLRCDRCRVFGHDLTSCCKIDMPASQFETLTLTHPNSATTSATN